MPQIAQAPIFVNNFGGYLSALNISAPTVVKSRPGHLYRVNILTAGSGGALVINDCASLAAASAANVILGVPSAQLPQGASPAPQWPCQSGIVISALPTGAVLSVSYD